MRVAVAAGGTAGHLAPALAVADELTARGSEVHCICGQRDADIAAIAERGYTAWAFPVQGLARRPGLSQLRAIWLAVRGVFRARRMLRARKIDAVLAGGGFVSAPVAVAAWTLRIPVVATEADAHIGLANRISARVARRLCTAYPLRHALGKQEVTGRPVARGFQDVDAVNARRSLGIPENARVLVVFGGSGGARRINEAVWDAWGEDSDPRIGSTELYVLHVVGRRDFPEFSMHQPASSRYQLIEYCTDMPTLLGAADLVVCRAGGSVFELAAVGVPAILVPYPYATANHQHRNAEHFVREGAAVVMEDAECSGAEITNHVDRMLAPGWSEELAHMAQHMRMQARPDAAHRIATIVASLARSHAAASETPEEHGAAEARTIVEASREIRLDVEPLAGRTFHMMGIGGAGVSALAQITAAWGADVSGCDQADSAYADLVRSRGVRVDIGHDSAHVHPDAEIIVSSALDASHPELQAARDLGCRTWLRGELLGELTRMRRTIVVAGAHGKSTTTAMISHVLHECGIDATVVLGATIPGRGNAHAGTSPWMVVEGDESDRTLLALDAAVAVITNIERDHHHTFPTDEALLDVFDAWLGLLADQTPLIAGSGPMVDDLVARHASRLRIVRIADLQSSFDALEGVLAVPGTHNVLNAVAAAAASCMVGVDHDDAVRELRSFEGIGRRFEQHGTTLRGALVVDDYAHHPSEVRATIQAARERIDSSGRVLVVFQPHLYTRTHELWSEFADALSTADRVWVLPIYGARERPIPGVTAALISDELATRAPHVEPVLMDVDPATGDVDSILEAASSGDIVITMGAGTITAMAPRLCSRATAVQPGVVVP